MAAPCSAGLSAWEWFASPLMARAAPPRSSAGASANASAILKKRRTARSGCWKTLRRVACIGSHRSKSSGQLPLMTALLFIGADAPHDACGVEKDEITDAPRLILGR